MTTTFWGIGEATRMGLRAGTLRAGGLLATLAVTVPLVGCGSEEGAATEDTQTLRFATGLAEDTALSEAQAWWLDEVEKRTDGELEFERHFDGSLYEALELAPALQSNSLDVGYISSAYQPAESPLWGISEVPFITDDPIASANAFYELSQESELFKSEFESLQIHPVTFQPIDVGAAFTVDPIESLDDFDGLQIRAVGLGAEALQALGASPVALDPSEQYESLSRGVIQGTGPLTFDVTPSQGLPEVAPNVTLLGSGVYGTAAIGFSEAAWSEISDDVKDVMAEVSQEYQEEHIAGFLEEHSAEACEVYLDEDAQFTIIPQEEVDAWSADVAEEVLDTWRANVETAGDSAEDTEQFLSDYQSAVEENSLGSDYTDGVTACAERS